MVYSILGVYGLNEQLREELPECPRISDVTVARILDSHLITRKLAGKEAGVPFERNSPRVKLARQQYVEFFTGLGIPGITHTRSSLIYVDESGYIHSSNAWLAALSEEIECRDNKSVDPEDATWF